jgi:hypothetical protein
MEKVMLKIYQNLFESDNCNLDVNVHDHVLYIVNTDYDLDVRYSWELNMVTDELIKFEFSIPSEDNKEQDVFCDKR